MRRRARFIRRAWGRVAHEAPEAFPRPIDDAAHLHFGDRSKLELFEALPENVWQGVRVVGLLTLPEETLVVESRQQAEEELLSPPPCCIGFVVRRGEQSVGAVQTLPPDRHVWVAQSAGPAVRRGVAMVASALLLSDRWNRSSRGE